MTGPPRRGSPFTRAAARGVLRLFGWRILGTLPAEAQFVVIVAPHTSNWDFPVCVFAMFATGLRLSWYGKHTLFRFPVNGLLRWFGGIPIDRRVAEGRVESAIARFREGTPWVLGVSPEGTRRRVEQWKLGFYRIAVGAGVPVVAVELDWGKRELRVGAAQRMTGDETADLAPLRARFSSVMAFHPRSYADISPA